MRINPRAYRDSDLRKKPVAVQCKTCKYLKRGFCTVRATLASLENWRICRYYHPKRGQ